MTIKRAVIPVAGRGTRLRPLTRLLPKELLPLGQMPVLAFVFEELLACGIENALLIVSPEKTQIKSVFGERYRGWETETEASLKLDYAIQTTQEGSGDAVRYAEAWTENEPFVVAFGDCLIQTPTQTPPLARMIQDSLANEWKNAVLVERVEPENVSKYGIIAPTNEDGLKSGASVALRDIVEKPALADAPSQFAIAARFLLTHDIFDALRESKLDPRGERNLPDALRLLLQGGTSVGATPLHEGEERRDIGSVAGYYKAFERAVKRERELEGGKPTDRQNFVW